MKKPILIFFFGLFVSACATKDAQPRDYTFYVEETNFNYKTVAEMKIGYTEDMLVSNSDFEWTSSREQIINVKEGVVSARKIGTATITALPRQGKPINITIDVKPIYKTYAEPLLVFGRPKFEVKHSPETRTLLEETANAFIYKGENDKIKQVVYNFENDKLISSEVWFVPAANILTEIETFLQERYPDTGTFEGRKTYLNESRQYRMSVVGSATEGYRVVYSENK